MSNDLFCEIIAGERPAHVVHSDEVSVSFLDTRPVFKGMCWWCRAPTSRCSPT